MSVRGERVIYREREREVDTYEEPQRRSYTTIKRYQVPDRDDRSAINEDVEEEKIVIRRERKEDRRGGRSEVGTRHSDRSSDRREEVDVRITERTTEREREPERRDVTYRIIERDSDHDRRSNAGGRSEYRERDFVRAPSPPGEDRVREYRFEREREYSPPRTMTRERDYDVERYSKTTDYYGQPQPIIIRESAPQPIIIREERRAPQIIIRREEPAYEIIEREEIKQEQQLVVKEDTPPPPASTVKSMVKSTKSEVQKPQEEDYYFERRIREVRRNDDIKPSDSASQYSSDDSYEYVRRERYVEDDRDSHHRLHLAEGALAGAAGAAIIRQHRKSQGKEDRHGAGKLLGGAALGALGAEAITRARSARASSRRREYDDYDDHDRRSRREHRHRSRSYEREEHRERSRSRSKSKAQKLGGLAAIAAVGALAGYAIKKSGEKNKETVIINEHSGRHRSRSRRRRSSVGSRYTEDDSKSTDAGQRNRRIAAAGAATAAAAGIWDRMRSKSRGGRERSKSRVRTGVPIVAAGLGGAALAGLYERNKASKEDTRRQIIEDERNRGRGRSRSRSTGPHGYDDDRRRDDMIAYGNDPIGRDGQRSYYDDEAPGSYQRRDRSVGGSPDNRQRSRSRARDLAPIAAAGVAGAAAAHAIGRDRSRDRSRSRSRVGRDRHYDDDRYSEGYPHGDYITPPPQGGNGYPDSNYFPPPPTDDRAAIEQKGYNDGYAPYNPADYPPAAAGASREPYSESNATLGAPNPHDTFAGDVRFADQAHQTAEARERQEDREMRQARADPGNVSSPPPNDRHAPQDTIERAEVSLDANPSTPTMLRRTQVAFESLADSISYPDGLEGGRNASVRSGSSTPRARSTSRVRFDLDSNTMHSPDDAARHRRTSQTTRNSEDEPLGEHRVGRTRSRRPASTLMNDAYERRSVDSDSDGTVDLPARFDEHGNRRPDEQGNDLIACLSEIFSGRGHSDVSRRSDHEQGPGGGGFIERILQGIAGELSQGNDDDGQQDRRSRR